MTSASGTQQIAEELIRDADLVTRVAVGLGKLRNESFLEAVEILRAEVEAKSPKSKTIGHVRTLLNEAMTDISPIILSDLRYGWTPWTPQGFKKRGVFWYAAFGLVLVVLCIWGTLLYGSATLDYASLVEVQKGKPNERVAKLFSLVDDERLVKALFSSDGPRVVSDMFTKMLYEAKAAEDILATFGPEAVEETLLRRLGRMVSGATPASAGLALETGGAPQGFSEKPLSGTAAPAVPGFQPLQPGLNAFSQQGLSLKLFYYLAELNRTMRYSDAKLTKMLRELHVGLSLVGLLVLPALYGMLGVCLYYLSRFVDAKTPNPPWGPTIFRTAMGAIIGVIAVAMFASSNASLTESTFSSPAVFGVAFFAGFGMDAFLRLLEQASNRVICGLGKS